MHVYQLLSIIHAAEKTTLFQPHRKVSSEECITSICEKVAISDHRECKEISQQVNNNITIKMAFKILI